MTLMRLESVEKIFRQRSGRNVHAVNGVTFEIEAGETLGLIGESGSGKSTVARLALGLIEPDSGTVEFNGTGIADLSKRDRRKLRSELTVVFQEPYESLNPRMTVGQIVEEPLIIHRPDLSRSQRRGYVEKTLDSVRLDSSLYSRYPKNLSGGQQQRVGIARALVTRPKMVVLDEPTSSLDVSVRAQILMLLSELQDELGLAYLFISHDIHTVEYVSDRLAIMYLGQIVETGDTSQVFAETQHPYTRGLLSSRLSPHIGVGVGASGSRYRLLDEIPSATELPDACFLTGRCPIEIDRCSDGRVGLTAYQNSGHEVACVRAPTSFWEGYPRAPEEIE